MEFITSKYVLNTQVSQSGYVFHYDEGIEKNKIFT